MIEQRRLCDKCGCSHEVKVRPLYLRDIPFYEQKKLHRAGEMGEVDLCEKCLRDLTVKTLGEVEFSDYTLEKILDLMLHSMPEEKRVAIYEANKGRN